MTGEMFAFPRRLLLVVCLVLFGAFLVPTVEARTPSKAKRTTIHHKKKTKKKKKKKKRPAKPKRKTTPRPPTSPTTSTTTSSGGQLAVVTSCGNVSAIPSAVNSTSDQA